MRTNLSMRPTGWFQVAWSADLGPEAVRPLRYFGTDLVAYRGRDGVVRVHDAYCLHLGANLAYGGCVTDDGIRCPFHGWEWGTDGSNVRIPYQERTNARRLGTWVARERNEAIYLWHDAAGRAPLWEVPDVSELCPEMLTQPFHEVGPEARTHFTGLQVHPQVVAENAVDPHHFRFVHGTPRSPVVLAEDVDEHSWRTLVGFGRRWSEHTGPVTDRDNTIDICWSGLGVSHNVEHTLAGIRIVAVNVTPVDDDTTELFATYWIDVREDGPQTPEQRIAEAQAALPDDIHIWNHQQYLDAPALATSEAASFTKLRAWAKGFYPEPAALQG